MNLIRRSIILFTVVILIGLSNQLLSQEDGKTISQMRKDNVIEILNYRFKGGYYTFEKVFQQSVEYPPVALGNCIMGIAIVSFRVNCEGDVYDLRIKTPLGYGIDNEISTFFANTAGKWNTCNDEKYTKFEVPIQFKIKGAETNTEDAMLILEGNNPGYLCDDDEYYLKKLNKYISKGKNKKIIQYVDIMIRRDPYNTEYYEIRKKAVNGEY